MEHNITDHKVALGQWVADNCESNPLLKLLFPITLPSSDDDTLILPVARFGYHGLILKLSVVDHDAVLGWLQDQAYSVVVCKNWKGAKEAIQRYLK